MDKVERIAWVDTLRFLGMWAIYVGHFGPGAGALHSFVFLYHVPLFFFASGFFAPSRELGVRDVLARTSRRLLLPYVFFSLLAVAAMAVHSRWGLGQLQQALVQVVLGVRNHLPAASLWFLNCLWVVLLLDFGVRKLLGRSWPVVGVAAGAMLLAPGLLPNEPSWIFNADSALHYWFWYALGREAWPALRRWEEVPAWLRHGTTLAFAGFALWLLLAGASAFLDPALRLVGRPAALATLTVLLIAANVGLSHWLARVGVVRRIGRESLVLCGVEDLVRRAVAIAAILLGFGATVGSPAAAALLALACMGISGLVAAPLLHHFAPAWAGLRSDFPGDGQHDARDVARTHG